MNHHLSPFISPCHSPAIREFRKNASPSMINLKSPSSSSRYRDGHINLNFISVFILPCRSLFFALFSLEINFVFPFFRLLQGQLTIFYRRWGKNWIIARNFVSSLLAKISNSKFKCKNLHVLYAPNFPIKPPLALKLPLLFIHFLLTVKAFF